MQSLAEYGGPRCGRWGGGETCGDRLATATVVLQCVLWALLLVFTYRATRSAPGARFVLPLRQVNGSMTPVAALGRGVCANADRYLHLPLRPGDLLVLWCAHFLVKKNQIVYILKDRSHNHKLPSCRLYAPQFAVDPALEERIHASGSVADNSAHGMLAPDPWALHALCPGHGNLRVAVMHTRSTVSLDGA